MTLFKITCDTCRTSLNVRQKSAIGQILACPKCGSMVQVKPPDDWETDEEPDQPRVSKKPFVKPVPDPNLPETVSRMSGSVADGLGETASKAHQKNEQRWQGDEDPTDSNSNRSNVVAPPNQPDLPGEQWDTARSRQRKKLLLAFSSASAILVFGIVAIVFAVMKFTGGNEENEKEQSKVTQVTDNKDADEKEKNDKSSDKTNPEKGKNTPSDKKDSTQVPKKSEEDNDSNSNKKTPEKNPKEQSKKEKKKSEGPAKNGDDPGKKKNVGDAPSDFATKTDDVDEGALRDFFSELESFTILFEQDEPLLKLREAFEENDLPGTYGLSRFFVSRSLKKLPDPKLALNVPIAQVNFKQTTLLEFLNFHYQLSGIPVSVDVTPILLAGIRLDEKFDFTASGKTTQGLLKELANQRGLEVIQGKNSLVLTIRNRQELVDVEYPVEDLVAGPSDSKKICQQISTYINRNTWSTEGGVGIVTANDESKTIVVKHYGWAQVRVAELLRHIRTRKELPAKNPNSNFPGNRHRLELAKEGLGKKINLLHADPVSLSELFSQLAKNDDLHVFINWESTGDKLLPSGHLPLAVEDEQFGQFISEFSEGIKLQLVWHTPNVVELTSRIGASSNLTFESYDIRKATSRTFPPEKLLKALRDLLATNNLADFEKAELGLDLVDQQAIYAVLPQSAHLNVSKILMVAETVSSEKKSEKK